ncbi:hypothetical protein [Mesorhizobium sp.]|uniref:hypothetical protein n=1 Tax=Mesorhizobium sp. TaxID=1871066 RepID=UPI000FE8BF82|nr:hypothetical protein [Mesorhizobium sp.]RWG33992.1 MAG: hypothetical protein EOQ60_10250 [Mesorhizobium sp.]TIS17643.1 MAG: hypothetical protein E5X10_02770 [Mesorhizobium sp.]
MTEADKIAAQISRADRVHEWAIGEAQKAVDAEASRDRALEKLLGVAKKLDASEARITDLRIALSDIIALDHHWHGPEGRATEIARSALLRDDDIREGVSQADIREPV